MILLKMIKLEFLNPDFNCKKKKDKTQTNFCITQLKFFSNSVQVCFQNAAASLFAKIYSFLLQQLFILSQTKAYF